MCVIRVYVPDCTVKIEMEKICLRYLYNVENKNTCESLMISLFKNVPAKKLWSCQVKISLLEKAVNFCSSLNNDNTGHL